MWNGLLVRKDFWEARPQQDFVRGIKEQPGVPDARPPQDNYFVGPYTVTREEL